MDPLVQYAGKMHKAHHGRSLWPSTPCLAKVYTKKNVAKRCGWKCLVGSWQWPRQQRLEARCCRWGHFSTTLAQLQRANSTSIAFKSFSWVELRILVQILRISRLGRKFCPTSSFEKVVPTWDFSWHLRWGPPPLDIGWRCIGALRRHTSVRACPRVASKKSHWWLPILFPVVFFLD